MAQIQPVLKIELNPADPVQEICAVIMAVMPYHRPEQEAVILKGVKKAIEDRLSSLQKKGADQNGKSVRKSTRKQ